MNCINCGQEVVNKRVDAIYCSNKCGNVIRQSRYVPSDKSKEAVLKNQRIRRSTVQGKFKAHKESAKQRGIEFKLTFDEWWVLWKPHWKDKLQGELCMCRNEDKGAYELGNVRIDTWANNIREARGLPLK
ncbi:hypothetical protein D3C87_1384300 [compost metagenome]